MGQRQFVLFGIGGIVALVVAITVVKWLLGLLG